MDYLGIGIRKGEHSDGKRPFPSGHSRLSDERQDRLTRERPLTKVGTLFVLVLLVCTLGCGEILGIVRGHPSPTAPEMAARCGPQGS